MGLHQGAHSKPLEPHPSAVLWPHLAGGRGKSETQATRYWTYVSVKWGTFIQSFYQEEVMIISYSKEKTKTQGRYSWTKSNSNQANTWLCCSATEQQTKAGSNNTPCHDASKTVSMISMRKQNALGAQRSEQNVQLVLEADPMLAGMSKRQRKRHTRKDIAEHRVLRD